MSKLEVLLKQFGSAISRLQDVLRQEKNEFIRDAAIQRFEFCFDLSWKALKAYLEEKEGIVCTSPKQCFRQAYQQKLVEYTDFWIELTDARNQTSHTYNEEIAEEIYAMLPKAAQSFQDLFQALGK